MELPFCIWLGGARPQDVDALWVLSGQLTSTLSILPPPQRSEAELQEDGQHFVAGLVWTVPDVPRGGEEEQALLADFRKVIVQAATFSQTCPVEVAVQYGCCEIGYIEGGEAGPGVADFFAEGRAVPDHEHP